MLTKLKLFCLVFVFSLIWGSPLHAADTFDLFIPAILAGPHQQQHDHNHSQLPHQGLQSWRFVVTGDSRGGEHGINVVVLQQIRAAILSLDPRPALVIFTGDLVAKGHEQNLIYWQNLFKRPLEQSNIAVYPLRGNHDGPAGRFATVFSGLPHNGPAGEKGLTYMVRYKNAEFYILDNAWGGNGLSSRTRNWLYEKLAASTARHGFIAGHSPLWGTGHHSPLYDDSDDPEVVELYRRSLAAHCSTYLCGHDHFFDVRIKNSSYGIFRQFLLGTAGAPLRDQDDPGDLDPKTSQLLHARKYGFSIFDISGSRVESRFVPINNNGGNYEYSYSD